MLREEPDLAGPVASDPVVSRLVSQLAGDLPRALKAVRSARAQARERAWALAGDAAPGADGGLVTVDLDATIVIAHSEKQEAAPTWKKTFGFHPLAAFADHGATENGEPLATVLRAGNAGSNTAADHIEASRLALEQLPRHLRRRVLVRTDSGGGTHGFLEWLTAGSRRLHYSVGMTVTEGVQDAVLKVPAGSWTPAYDGDGQVRDGPWVADITGLLDLSSWPAGMRVIVRKKRPHSGAQLRFTDLDGHRFTAFATNARKGQLADLELRHRRRARCEDRIRCAKDTGLRNLPLKGFAQNQLWCEIAAGLRAAGLDPAARPDRASPPLGTQTAPAAPVLRCRTPRPAAAAACGSASPSAGPGPARSPQQSPACKPCHLADQPEPFRRHERTATMDCGTPPTGTTAGQPGTAGTRKSTSAEHLRPADQGRERSVRRSKVSLTLR